LAGLGFCGFALSFPGPAAALEDLPTASFDLCIFGFFLTVF